MGWIDRYKPANDGVVEDALEQVAQLRGGSFEAVISLAEDESLHVLVGDIPH